MSAPAGEVPMEEQAQPEQGPRTKAPWRRVARVVLGTLLVVLGIAGLFLPFLQGFILILAGIFVLAHDVPAFRRVRDWLRHRFPGISHSVDRLKVRARQALRGAWQALRRIGQSRPAP